MEPADVRLRDLTADKREAANKRVKTLQRLFACACEPTRRLAKVNAVRECPLFVSQNPGAWEIWMEDDVDAFERHFPLGVKAPLAFDLFCLHRRPDLRRAPFRAGDGARRQALPQRVERAQ